MSPSRSGREVRSGQTREREGGNLRPANPLPACDMPQGPLLQRQHLARLHFIAEDNEVQRGTLDRKVLRNVNTSQNHDDVHAIPH